MSFAPSSLPEALSLSIVRLTAFKSSSSATRKFITSSTPGISRKAPSTASFWASSSTLPYNDKTTPSRSINTLTGCALHAVLLTVTVLSTVSSASRSAISPSIVGLPVIAASAYDVEYPPGFTVGVLGAIGSSNAQPIMPMSTNGRPIIVIQGLLLMNRKPPMVIRSATPKKTGQKLGPGR